MLCFRAFVFAPRAYSQRAIRKQCWFSTGFTRGIFHRMLLRGGSWPVPWSPWYHGGREGPAPPSIPISLYFPRSSQQLGALPCEPGAMQGGLG